jgi:hypothetical protein
MTSDMTPGDLWSAPASAQPADGLLAGHVPGPSRHAAHKAARGTRRSRRVVEAGRLPRRSMSLAIAVTVLIGLGFAAQRLDPARGTAPGSPDTISTQNPSPAASPSTASTPGNGAAEVRTGGPPDCPMQAASGGLDCFYIG